MTVLARGTESRAAARVTAAVSYLFLARFPLLLAAVILGFGPVAQFLFPKFLRSSLVLDRYGLRHLAFVASLAALTVMVTRHIVLLHGPARFGTPRHRYSRRLTLRHTITHLALVVPLLWAVVANSREEVSALVLSVWAGTGVGAALALFWVVIAAQYVIARPDHQTADALLPFGRLRDGLRRQDRVPARLREPATRLSSRLASLLGPGYVGADGSLLPYHGLSIAMLVASSVAYAIYYFRGMPGTAVGAAIPAVAYLLVLATAWTWLLAVSAFLLDRFRLPVVLVVLAWSAGVSFYAKSDHYFQHFESPPTTFSTPAAIAAANDPAPLLVAAADGGGIQAAAWTALVLAEIERAWPDFGRSLRLVSSVSGGSVGSMYFVNAFDRDRPPSPSLLDEIVSLAARGAINESWWGWAYPDFWRTLLPLPRSQRFLKDRGWSLERAWARGWDGGRLRLSDLAAATASGRKPAVAFNATIVETGRRFVIASFQVPEAWHVASFSTTYAGRDLEMVTAARLSATFPYVTPVSRAWPDTGDRSAQHIADGGYYDNTGVLTALQWLGDVLRANPGRYQHRPIGVLRLAAFPDYQGRPIKDRSTLYQAIAPLVTQFSVLRAAQVDRMNAELEHFTSYWCTQGIEVALFTFQFRQDAPPLTWSLTPSERRTIAEEWQSETNQAALGRLVALTRADGGADPCPAPLPPSP